MWQAEIARGRKAKGYGRHGAVGWHRSGRARATVNMGAKPPYPLYYGNGAVRGENACGGQEIGEHTRMTGRWSLPTPHAMLTVSLPESACSLMICPTARGVDNSLASQRMLAQALPTASAKGGTRMARMGKLSAPHATLAASFPESKCSPIPCLPRALSFRTAPFSSQVRGDRGRATPEWQNRKNCSFCTRCC